MIQRTSGIAASLAGLLVLLAGCTTGSTTTLNAELSGADAAPDPADPDGSGTASITLDEANDEVCWEITVEGIEAATAAHIHRGAAGTAGPVVVPLSAPETGSSDGCAEADSELIEEILATPSEFYVNVHNEEFPGGAIRGQLSA